jgi:hypothetical protein
MKLGRILRESFEGAVPRLVLAQPERDFEQTLVYYSLPSVARE